MKGKIITAGVAGLLYFANPSQAQENKVGELTQKIDDLQTQLSTASSEDSTSIGYNQARRKLESMVTERDSLASEPVELPETQRQNQISPGVIADGYIGSQGTRGARLGLNKGRFNFLASLENSEDHVTKEIRAELLKGKYATGIERETGINSYGLDIEAELGSSRRIRALIGGGIQKINYTKEVEETLYSKEGAVIDADAKSNSENRFSGRGYAGVNINTGKGFSVRGFGGYSQNRGGFGGVGIAYSPQKTTPRQ
ncbi:MAG: hypothetical protein KKC19_03600 [Nanoarchaeota archaeon]|nr:hypothetical protein [Nanoarchaeota archaeon]